MRTFLFPLPSAGPNWNDGPAIAGLGATGSELVQATTTESAVVSSERFERVIAVPLVLWLRLEDHSSEQLASETFVTLTRAAWGIHPRRTLWPGTGVVVWNPLGVPPQEGYGTSSFGR